MTLLLETPYFLMSLHQECLFLYNQLWHNPLHYQIPSSTNHCPEKLFPLQNPYIVYPGLTFGIRFFSYERMIWQWKYQYWHTFLVLPQFLPRLILIISLSPILRAFIKFLRFPGYSSIYLPEKLNRLLLNPYLEGLFLLKVPDPEARSYHLPKEYNLSLMQYPIHS